MSCRKTMQMNNNRSLDVLIVDDEKTALDIVIESIDWDSYNVCAFSATSGEKALEIITNNSIQMVITDIKMPGMDGLELIRRINSLKRGIICLVMSSYNEFDLVRAAMRLGAVDYIFKPSMMPEDIIQTIQKVREKVQVESDNAETIKIANRKEAFRILLNAKNIISENQQDLTNQLGIADAASVYVLHLRIVHYNNKLKNGFSGDYDLLGFTLENTITEIAGKHLSCDVVDLNFHEYILVSWNVQDDSSLKLFASELSKDIHKYYGADIIIGVSSPAANFATIRDLNQQSIVAVDRAEMLQSTIVSYSSDRDGSLNTSVKQAVEYINDNITNKELSLQATAKYVGVSASYLSRLFKEKIGINFVDFVTNKKLEKAKELYSNSNMKIYEVAEELGYSDWHYLYTLYKKKYGHSLSKEKRRNLNI